MTEIIITEEMIDEHRKNGLHENFDSSIARDFCNGEVLTDNPISMQFPDVEIVIAFHAINGSKIEAMMRSGETSAAMIIDATSEFDKEILVKASDDATVIIEPEAMMKLEKIQLGWCHAQWQYQTDSIRDQIHRYSNENITPQDEAFLDDIKERYNIEENCTPGSAILTVNIL